MKQNRPDSFADGVKELLDRGTDAVRKTAETTFRKIDEKQSEAHAIREALLEYDRLLQENAACRSRLLKNGDALRGCFREESERQYIAQFNGAVQNAYYREGGIAFFLTEFVRFTQELPPTSDGAALARGYRSTLEPAVLETQKLREAYPELQSQLRRIGKAFDTDRALLSAAAWKPIGKLAGAVQNAAEERDLAALAQALSALRRAVEQNRTTSDSVPRLLEEARTMSVPEITPLYDWLSLLFEYPKPEKMAAPETATAEAYREKARQLCGVLQRWAIRPDTEKGEDPDGSLHD